MKKKKIKRENYSTRLDPVLLNKLKHLAIDMEEPVNMLLEEAIILLLQKYETVDK